MIIPIKKYQSKINPPQIIPSRLIFFSLEFDRHGFWRAGAAIGGDDSSADLALFDCGALPKHHVSHQLKHVV